MDLTRTLRSAFIIRRCLTRRLATAAPKGDEQKTITLGNKAYHVDDYTNVTPKIISHIGRNLHNKPQHPLCLLKQRIVKHFYKKFISRTGTPVFSFYDNLNPVVSVEQNFDSLLIPESHVSRNKSDCYYINRKLLLRGHTTAHQSELVRMGFDNFLIFGDVYRRDEIDSTHYPVFHQADAVRLCNNHLLSEMAGGKVEVFEKKMAEDCPDRQAVHTLDATKIMEQHLKSTLVALAQTLFGPNVSYKWVDVYFPFTHPSWELEVEFKGKWIEVLGCGIMRHDILQTAGAVDRIGWAFGLGLERLAMMLYEIPDIRLFWSNDTGFLSQFEDADLDTLVRYKPVSVYPQCCNDLSFWLPEDREFVPNDFFELAREVGGDLVEQVKLVDEFCHPKTGRKSMCYRLVYRHLERTLTQEEVNQVHSKVAETVARNMNVTIR